MNAEDVEINVVDAVDVNGCTVKVGDLIKSFNDHREVNAKVIHIFTIDGDKFVHLKVDDGVFARDKVLSECELADWSIDYKIALNSEILRMHDKLRDAKRELESVNESIAELESDLSDVSKLRSRLLEKIDNLKTDLNALCGRRDRDDDEV